jgi:hypothetical protein
MPCGRGETAMPRNRQKHPHIVPVQRHDHSSFSPDNPIIPFESAYKNIFRSYANFCTVQQKFLA